MKKLSWFEKVWSGKTEEEEETRAVNRGLQDDFDQCADDEYVDATHALNRLASIMQTLHTDRKTRADLQKIRVSLSKTVDDSGEHMAKMLSKSMHLTIELSEADVRCFACCTLASTIAQWGVAAWCGAGRHTSFVAHFVARGTGPAFASISFVAESLHLAGGPHRVP